MAVAWPYASGPRHLGHVGGGLFAARHIRAIPPHEGQPRAHGVGQRHERHAYYGGCGASRGVPGTWARRIHRLNTELWHRMGFTYDLFTDTTTPIHYEVVQDFFLTLLKKGYVYKDTTIAPYCPVDKRFLPDRYVEGTCPHCGYANARGDQCDNCGRPLDPIDLIDPRCRCVEPRLSSGRASTSSWICPSWRSRCSSGLSRRQASGGPT